MKLDFTNKDLHSLKNILITVISISLILTIIIYLYYFNNGKVSTDSKDWGNLGDYISGILNPIIGIFNLIILVYIAIIANNFNSNLHNQSEKVQKGLAKKQIIFEISKSFIIDFEKLLITILEKDNNEYRKMCYKIDGHITSLIELKVFDSKNEYIENLSKVCNLIGESYNPQQKKFIIDNTQINELSAFRKYFISTVFNNIDE